MDKSSWRCCRVRTILQLESNLQLLICAEKISKQECYLMFIGAIILRPDKYNNIKNSKFANPVYVVSSSLLNTSGTDTLKPQSVNDGQNNTAMKGNLYFLVCASLNWPLVAGSCGRLISKFKRKFLFFVVPCDKAVRDWLFMLHLETVSQSTAKVGTLKINYVKYGRKSRIDSI